MWLSIYKDWHGDIYLRQNSRYLCQFAAFLLYKWTIHKDTEYIGEPSLYHSQVYVWYFMLTV